MGHRPGTGRVGVDTTSRAVDARAGSCGAVGRRTAGCRDTGKLFTVDPGTGVTRTIAVNATLTNGDGLLLQGRTLYVVQNRDDKIAVVSLTADLHSDEW
jgi:sugar lactone lactonase YvrE